MTSRVNAAKTPKGPIACYTLSASKVDAGLARLYATCRAPGETKAARLRLLDSLEEAGEQYYEVTVLLNQALARSRRPA